MQWSHLKRVLLQFLWPNGAIVLFAMVLIGSGLLRAAVASVADYAAVAVIAAGLMVAWRFHAMRCIAALLAVAALTLALRNVGPSHGASPALFDALSFLLPLNLIALLMVEEFTLSLEPIAYWFGFLTLQAGLLSLT